MAEPVEPPMSPELKRLLEELLVERYGPTPSRPSAPPRLFRPPSERDHDDN